MYTSVENDGDTSTKLIEMHRLNDLEIHRKRWACSYDPAALNRKLYTFLQLQTVPSDGLGRSLPLVNCFSHHKT